MSKKDDMNEKDLYSAVKNKIKEGGWLILDIFNEGVCFIKFESCRLNLKQNRVVIYEAKFDRMYPFGEGVIFSVQYIREHKYNFPLMILRHCKKEQTFFLFGVCLSVLNGHPTPFHPFHLDLCLSCKKIK